MSCPCPITVAYSRTAALIRKVQPARRFDRVKASRALTKKTDDYWQGGLDALWQYLAERDRWEKIQQFVTARRVQGCVRKELDTDERKFLSDLLSSFGYYDDVSQVAATIAAATRLDTFAEAANFALRQLGVRSANFELRNEAIKQLLLDRKSADVFAARNNIDSIMDSVLTNFYDLGSNPYDAEFLASLKSEMGAATTYQAKRFALTETAIAAELAQAETYKRNGVERKQWNALGKNTRPSHAALDGAQVPVDERFKLQSSDGNVYEADHPADPELPAHELVNCHCWLSPVLDDDFTIDPGKIWEGE